MKPIDTLPRVAPGVPGGVGDDLADWLGRLECLYGVPFANLVADERLLPRESIRFFYVDPNWIAALRDGACSVGIQSAGDEATSRSLAAPLRRIAETAAAEVRSRLRSRSQPAALRDEPPATGADAGGTRTGMLLRSAVVSGFVGLELLAFTAGPGGEEPQQPLRIERLAPDVLLAIFDGVLDRVTIREPCEDLHFSILVGDAGAEVQVREVAGPSSGAPRPGEVVNVDDLVGPAGTRIDVFGLQDRLRQALGLPLPDRGDASLEDRVAWGPGGFAIQLFTVPQEQNFERPDPAAGGMP